MRCHSTSLITISNNVVVKILLYFYNNFRIGYKYTSDEKQVEFGEEVEICMD